MRQANILPSKYEISNPDHVYDKDNDIFYVYKKNSHVYTTVMIGEFHIEYDKQGKIIGLEVTSASTILKELGISKNMILKRNKVKLKVIQRNNMSFIGLFVSSPKMNKEAVLPMANMQSPIMKEIMATVY